MTNLEKIRAMSAEELAKFINNVSSFCDEYSDCRFCPFFINSECYNADIKKWLESEVSK